jgi:hypothetical protein
VCVGRLVKMEWEGGTQQQINAFELLMKEN